MNTDTIYAEHIANEYSSKDTSKVVALQKLDRKAKLSAVIFIGTIHYSVRSTFEATKKWTMPLRNRGLVYGELSVMYEDRLP